MARGERNWFRIGEEGSAGLGSGVRSKGKEGEKKRNTSIFIDFSKVIKVAKTLNRYIPPPPEKKNPAHEDTVDY